MYHLLQERPHSHHMISWAQALTAFPRMPLLARCSPTRWATGSSVLGCSETLTLLGAWATTGSAASPCTESRRSDTNPRNSLLLGRWSGSTFNKGAAHRISSHHHQTQRRVREQCKAHSLTHALVARVGGRTRTAPEPDRCIRYASCNGRIRMRAYAYSRARVCVVCDHHLGDSLCGK